MTKRWKQILVGMTALAAVAMCVLRASLAQNPPAAQPGDAELNAVLQLDQAPQGNGSNVPRRGRRSSVTTSSAPQLPTSVADPRAAQLDELRRLIDEATRLIAAAKDEPTSKQAAERLDAIVERLNQLDPRVIDDPLASPRERAAKPSVIDSQRMDLLREILTLLPAAQSNESKVMLTQRAQNTLQQMKALVAKRMELEGVQQNTAQISGLAPQTTSAVDAPPLDLELVKSLQQIRSALNETARTLSRGTEQPEADRAISRLASALEEAQQRVARNRDLLRQDPGSLNSSPLKIEGQQLMEIRKVLNEYLAAPTPEAKAAIAKDVQKLADQVEAVMRQPAPPAQSALPLLAAVQSGGATLPAPAGRAPARGMGGGRGRGRDPNQLAQPAPDEPAFAPNPPTTVAGAWQGSSNWVGAPALSAEDLEWRQISSGLQNQIRQASDKMQNATEESKKDEAKKQLRDLLNQYFDQDTMRREKELASIEERVKNLRDQLTRRKDKKQEIIALQIKVAENEADGLGFFGTQTDGQTPADVYTRPWDHRAPAVAVPSVNSVVPAPAAPQAIRRVPAAGGQPDMLLSQPPPGNDNPFGNAPAQQQQPQQPQQPLPLR